MTVRFSCEGYKENNYLFTHIRIKKSVWRKYFTRICNSVLLEVMLITKAVICGAV